MSESTRGWIDLDDYDADALAEVNRLVDQIEAAREPDYARELREGTSAGHRIHGVRLPSLRDIGLRWLFDHADEHSTFLLSVCEILWATDWREERILALFLIYKRDDLRDRIQWKLLEQWAAESDSTEVIDYLGAVAGLLLSRNPRSITQVQALAGNENPFLRRFGLVTLIVASRDEAWRHALKAMVEQLSQDAAPEVQGQLSWARNRLR